MVPASGSGGESLRPVSARVPVKSELLLGPSHAVSSSCEWASCSGPGFHWWQPRDDERERALEA